MDFSLPKKERLTNKKHFERVFEEGKQLKHYPLKLVYAREQFNDNVPVKAAFVAPKKAFRKAVHRNRIKRLLREAYRLNKHLIFNNIEGNFAFVFLYIGRDLPDFKRVEGQMKSLLKSFQKKELHEKNP